MISVNTAAELLEITSRAVRKNCLKNAYTVQTVSSNVGRGGVSYQIDLASLPERAQVRYWETRNEAAAPENAAGDREFRESKESKVFRDGGKMTPQPQAAAPLQQESRDQIAESKSASDADAMDEAKRLPRNGRSEKEATLRDDAIEGVAKLNAKNREILSRNLEIVEFFAGLKGAEIDSAIIQWNAKKGDSLNKRTVYRTIQAYREGGAGAIAGKYGGRKGETSVSDEWFGIFMKAYAMAGNPTSINACREVVRGYAIKTGQIEPDADFPSAHAFRRRLKSMPQQALNMMRLGLDYHKQHNAYYIDIDRDEANCGDVFVADHAKFDFFVRTKADRLVRPWISALCDYKSRLIVGYDLFLDDPNGDHIIIVLKRSFEAYGIPKILLFDNGKDYRRKDIGGGRAAATNECCYSNSGHKNGKKCLIN